MKKFGKILAIPLALSLALGVPAVAFATESATPTVGIMVEQPPVNDKKVTICHATGSETNPFVEITISENAVDAHFSDKHQRGEDTFGPCPSPSPEPSETPKPRELPQPSESPAPSESPTVTPTTPAPTVSPSTPAPTVSPSENAVSCPGLSDVGTFANASGNEATLTVKVNGEVTPFSLIGVGNDTPLPGVFTVHETDFEFPGIVHLLDLNVGDVVSISITDGRAIAFDSGVVRDYCGVGLEVALEKFVGPPVVPTPVTPVPTASPATPVAPSVTPSPSESATPTVVLEKRTELPLTGINVGALAGIALLLILLGVLASRSGRLRR